MKWSYKPAKWYQFWLPQSGLAGGTILGCIVSAALVALLLLTGKL